MNKIIAVIFVIFGTTMGLLCLSQAVRKILDGERTFSLRKLIKNFNEFNGSLNDYSGIEFLAIGMFLIAATIPFYCLLLIS
jgi:hypothetical protein